MAAPSFVGAGAGVTIATGSAAVTAAGSGVAVGDLIILQVLQDGVAASAVTYSAISGIANLAGTASSLTTLATDQPCGTLAKQHLRVGRATSTTCSVTVATTGDDLYYRIYVFRNVNSGTALTDILENGTAGTITNGSGATAAIADTGVTTLDVDRLPLNFVGVDDDNPLTTFAGATGGVWAEAVAAFVTATGTDAAIQLQLGLIGATVQAAGTAVNNSLGNASTQAARATKFTAPATGTITLCQVNLAAVGAPTDDLIVEIRTDSGGTVPSSTVVGTSVTLDVTSTTRATYTAAVAAPVTSGTAYWIVVRRTGAVDAANYYSWESGSGTDGAARLNVASWVALAGLSQSHTVLVGSGAAGTIDGGTQTMAAADNWGVIGFALKPLPSGPTTHYGATSSAYTLNQVTAARRRTTSSVAMPVAFAAVVAGTGSTPTLPLLATLEDSFTAGLDKTTKWDNSSAGAYWDTTGKRAALPCLLLPDSTYISTNNLYDLTSSALSARPTPPPNTGTDGYLDMRVYSAAGVATGECVAISCAAGLPDSFGAWRFAAGTWTPIGTQTDYDPVAHAYWRIRETGGTIHYETSPDGQTWNSLASETAPFAVTAVVPSFECFYGSGAPAADGYVDDVNVTTVYGALAAPFAFNAATAARRRTTSQVAAPFTFTKAVAAQRKTFGVTATPLTFTKAVAGQRKTFGALAAPFTFAAVTQAVRKALGALTAPFTFSAATAGQKRIRGTANLHVTAVGVTHYGQVTAPFGFGAVVQGRRRTTSSLAAPFTFSATHAGSRKAFGALTAPFVFGEVTQGRRRTTSSLSAPFTFTKDVRAQRRTTGAITAPFVFGAVVASRKQYARLTAPIVFGEVTAGRKHTRGAISFPITFGAATAGIGYTGAATYFGATATTITFSKAVQGTKKTYGVVARPITFAAVVQGRRTTKSQLVAVYTWSSTTQAKRKTHAQTVMTVSWLAVTRGVSTVGIQTYYGVVARPTTLTITTVGQRRTRSTISLPITFDAFTKGMLMAAILNYADDIRWGSIQADRVMVGSTEVWTPGEDL